MVPLISNKSFLAQFNRTLGSSVFQAADIGECYSVLDKLNPHDLHSWYAPWRQLADRLFDQAQHYHSKENYQSMRTALQRATSYYRTAFFFLEDYPDDYRIQECLNLAAKAFQQALPWQPFKTYALSIPFEDIALPAYWIPASQNGKAPVLIDTGGGDSSIEELFLATAPAAHLRGFHTLIIEGPGQGKVLRQKKIPFIHDWERVISAAIDFLEKIFPSMIGPIALKGISFGGYLAARAACFEKRLAACIIDPGIGDASGKALLDSLPREVSIMLAEGDDESFNAFFEKAFKDAPDKQFLFKSRFHRFGTSTYAGTFRRLLDFNLMAYAKQISCPILICDNELEHLAPGEAKKLFEQITSDKTYKRFTQNDGCGGHCQPLGQLATQEFIFSWLKEKLEDI